ncbi:hypothetical protein I6M33_03890 [Shewanella algae]|uniref:hypothetical protein n=1 Tax=Shewanella algae TaxID=38313 RepID=UPI001AAD9179|nr:hypothetical protein [Shewanella algae]MBO2559761.1 hypothetical protein [Shewanella algae]
MKTGSIVNLNRRKTTSTVFLQQNLSQLTCDCEIPTTRKLRIASKFVKPNFYIKRIYDLLTTLWSGTGGRNSGTDITSNIMLFDGLNDLLFGVTFLHVELSIASNVLEISSM